MYQYEHIEPFERIRDHIPKDIALLCATHHDNVTRRRIAKDTVRKKRAAPYRVSHPWPHSSFYPSAESFPVILGGAQFISPRTVLRILGRDLLSIREPECEDGPIRLSAEFYDNRGKQCLVIEDNECKFNPRSWDIEAKGTCTTIRSAPRAVALRIHLCPDRLYVDRLAMQYRGVQIEANKRELKVFSKATESYRLSGWVRSPDVGIEINRKCSSDVLKLPESRRTINVLGSGGHYKITGRQPPNTEINFWGGARSVTVDIDGAVNLGGPPPTPRLGFALSQRAGMSLSLDDMEILIGAGARASSLSVGSGELKGTL